MAPPKPKETSFVPATRRMTVGTLSLDELKAQHRERVESNRRVEELKLSVLRITEHNIDQVVRIIRRWLRS
ncbi:MAG: hypothetical protein IJU76_10925 [Desulfovibrionaceae bacterium]|nr:hypothetical protein [Desulfovibrionaceae bacterium]